MSAKFNDCKLFCTYFEDLQAIFERNQKLKCVFSILFAVPFFHALLYIIIEDSVFKVYV